MTVRFEVATELPVPPADAFDLSLDIDEHVASMAQSGERAIAGVTSGRIGPGEQVTWRARHFGLPITMTSCITEYERPVRFVDEQVRGPFAWFRHEHRFDSVPGGTRMTDVITFRAPAGPIGVVAEHLVLARYLEQLIVLRNRHLLDRARVAVPGIDDEPAALGRS